MRPIFSYIQALQAQPKQGQQRLLKHTSVYGYILGLVLAVLKQRYWAGGRLNKIKAVAKKGVEAVAASNNCQADCKRLYKLSCRNSLALINKQGKASKACTDRACADGACTDRAYIDGACIDRACTDKAYTDGVSIDRTCIDRACTGGAYTDGAYTGGAFADKAYINKACTDGACVDKACTDKTYTDGTCADRTYTDKTCTGKAYRPIMSSP